MFSVFHRFHFDVNDDGVVEFVHHHHEERDEVLMLKKALASCFTTHRKVSTKHRLAASGKYKQTFHTTVSSNYYT